MHDLRRKAEGTSKTKTPIIEYKKIAVLPVHVVDNFEGLWVLLKRPEVLLVVVEDGLEVSR